LAMYNTPFYSFRFPLANLFGIFWVELMVRNFQDQNYGVSSWEKWTILTLLYEFNRGSRAAEATWDICAIYEEDSNTERTAQKWFARFKQGNFDMSDIPCLVWPSNFDEDFLNALIHADPHQTWELAWDGLWPCNNRPTSAIYG
jgi:hypothetical protein